ncbi:MAG TPA: hypothetical protein VK672_01695 [Solirubrobacteraceae bacterium]|jgi:hypothetical protein|nr:hypothetical protein [Solirubrobacteraceae bacterium]
MCLLGRRRSVAETIARRLPSARARPGAGCLPVLASGRLRARLRRCKGTLVSLWRRGTGEVYRVYGEEEYLSADGVHGSERSSRPPAGEEGFSPFLANGSHGPRSGRLLGLGLLLGVTLGAVGLVAVNVFGPHGAPSSTAIGRAGAGSHRPASTSAEHGLPARAQPAAVLSSGRRSAPTRIFPVRSVGAHAPTLRPALPRLRGSFRHTKPAGPASIAGVEQRPPSGGGISVPAGPAPPVIGEFGFEG